jgi:hypothetical protein
VTFFDVINDILFHKRGDKLNNVDHDQHMVPFLLNRWISMHSPALCRYVNDTMNRYIGLFDDKRDMYRAYLNIIPKVNKKFIRYIKKTKVEPVEPDVDAPDVSLIARELELSEREINMYIQHECQHRSTNTN